MKKGFFGHLITIMVAIFEFIVAEIWKGAKT